MQKQPSVMSWLDDQNDQMLDQLIRWSNINTHTFNLDGLAAMTQKIRDFCKVFDADITEISIPSHETHKVSGAILKQSLAPILSLHKRLDASIKILLVCHLDTVYLPDSIFQDAKTVDQRMLKGPGVADAKGGIMVMLKSLEAFEQTEVAKNIGWQIIFNTDEEIGSPGSREILFEIAKHFDYGFVFEPCLSNGNLIGQRKGSGNFTLIARGLAAHAGRNPHEGRNAIDALAKCVVGLNKLNDARPNLTVNVGVIKGGIAPNVVANAALARFNIRIQNEEDHTFVHDEVKKIVDAVCLEDEVEIEIHGQFTSPPKLIDDKTLKLYQNVQKWAKDLGMNLEWEDSGGVCDGNHLAAAGLPTIDTMGVQGGKIHSFDEYILIKSLVERAKLMTTVLINIAEGKLS